jgi:hypothetical protein
MAEAPGYFYTKRNGIFITVTVKLIKVLCLVELNVTNPMQKAASICL